MRKNPLNTIILPALVALGLSGALAEEKPYGRGLTEANKERLIIDDMEDVSDWYCAKEEESTVTAEGKQVKAEKSSLFFATRINHKAGEKNYPIGWPRLGKRLDKELPTDWTAYDFLEFWVYGETSRGALPHTPISIGIRHSGNKNSTTFRLHEVKKDEWVKIAIPIAKLKSPEDVQSLQFHLNESDYRHGDQADFHIDDMVLTRFVDPTIVTFAPERRLIFDRDPWVSAIFSLSGYQGMDRVKVQLEIVRGTEMPAAEGVAKGARHGEVTATLPEKGVPPGDYVARLSLRDAAGKLVDRQEKEIRILDGPF